MFIAKEKFTTAVDISDGLVRVVAVSSNKGEKCLAVLDSAKLSSDKDKEIASKLRFLISKNRLGKSAVFTSLPRHLVTARYVRLPTSDEAELKNMAELQTIKYLPYSREDIIASHKMVGTTEEGYTDILLVLAQRKSVTRYLDIFRHAGIPIEKLALSSEGLLNWYLSLQFEDALPVAVIDFDRYHTHIQVMKNKTILFSRSVSFDTVDPDADRNNLLNEIRISFDSYSKERDENVSRVILCGRDDYARQFSLFLSDNISVPCEPIEQLRNIKVKESVKESLRSCDDTSYTHLLGIVLEPDKLTLDLLPRDVIEERKEELLKSELIKTGILFLAVAVAGFGILEKEIVEKRSYLKKIEGRLKEIEPEAKRLLRLRENVELIRHQMKFEGSSIDVLRELYQMLPRDISLTLFEFEDKNRILIRGTAKELAMVTNLLPVLEKSTYFENVKINYAQTRTFKQKEFADFEIVCPLENP